MPISPLLTLLLGNSSLCVLLPSKAGPYFILCFMYYRFPPLSLSNCVPLISSCLLLLETTQAFCLLLCNLYTAFFKIALWSRVYICVQMHIFLVVPCAQCYFPVFSLHICSTVCEWFCAFLHAAVKCMKPNCIFCIAKCKMPYCRERDYAFVSRAYADECFCPTNVTSHNPEKLHQSHLITHIHDAVLHSAGSIFLLQATELRDVVEWKSFQSTDSVRLLHKHQLDNATSMPIFFMIWDHYGKMVFSYFLQSVIFPLPAACSNLVGIFNKEISFVLDYEGHFENRFN